MHGGPAPASERSAPGGLDRLEACAVQHHPADTPQRHLAATSLGSASLGGRGDLVDSARRHLPQGPSSQVGDG